MTAPVRIARAALLLHGDGASIEDAALAWRGDEIVAVGPARAVRRAFADSTPLGGRDVVLIPGLVNAHQHGHGVTALAGGVADEPLEAWLMEGVGLPVLPDRVTILLAAARMIRSGTTTAVHLHACRARIDPGRMRARLRAYGESGLSVAFAAGFTSRRRFALVDDERFLATLDPALRSDVEARFGAPPALDYFPAREWAAAMRALSSELPEDDSQRLLAGPPGPAWCTPEDLEVVADVASSLGLGVQVHVAESPLQARAAQDEPPIRALERAGLLGPRTSLVHVVHPAAGDLEMLRGSGASVVTCPGSNLRLRHGVAPLSRIVEAGAEVALGSDSLGFGDRDDLFAEARLLVALHGGAPGLSAPGARTLTAADAWRALTATGAKVAQMPRAGRLEPGARADFVLIDLAGLGPGDGWMSEPAAAVLGRARPQDVRTVVARGREILVDGRVTCFDEASVLAEASEALARARRDGSRSLASRLAAAVRRAHETAWPDA